jgi:hypothetical protein
MMPTASSKPALVIPRCVIPPLSPRTIAAPERVDELAKPAILREPSHLRRTEPEPPGSMGFFDRQDRRPVAVLVTRDGRHVSVLLDELEPGAGRASFRFLLLSLLGLVGLITGSRREPGGRRTER